MTLLQWATGILIAAIGAMIAYRQWETAHHRVLLDLFDRRMGVYEDLRKAIASIATSGQVSPDIEREYWRAQERAQFLFGQDVSAYLDELWKQIVELDFRNKELEGSSADRGRAAKARAEAFKSVTDFFTKGPTVFGPYIRLDQRMPSRWMRSR